MKKEIAISLLLTLFLVKCKTTRLLNGTYSDGNNIELKINGDTKEFEYFFKSGMGIIQYSRGRWETNKKKIRFLGLEKKDLKKINIEAIINNANSSQTNVEIYCKKKNMVNYIKSNIIINDSNSYTISKDTTIYINYTLRTIQVKSYLSYTGLLSSNPSIDTLYTSRININNASNTHKNIVLKFTVHPYDFSRVLFKDTAIIKSNHTLYLNQTRLKKIGP